MRKTFAAIVVASCLLTLLAAPASAANTDVHILGGAPRPAEVTVDEGDTVTFVNDDDSEHTIFAAGQPRGNPIAPHSRELFGPFDTGGQKGTFAYTVDQHGSAGTIFVRGPATSSSSATSTTRPTTTTAQPTTTAPTTTAPTTTAAAAESSTTSDSSTTTTTTTLLAAQSDNKKNNSSNRLAVLGFALLVAGVGGLVVSLERSRRRRR